MRYKKHTGTLRSVSLTHTRTYKHTESGNINNHSWGPVIEYMNPLFYWQNTFPNIVVEYKLYKPFIVVYIYLYIHVYKKYQKKRFNLLSIN